MEVKEASRSEGKFVTFKGNELRRKARPTVVPRRVTAVEHFKIAC